jgi:hypothetical protein
VRWQRREAHDMPTTLDGRMIRSLSLAAEGMED